MKAETWNFRPQQWLIEDLNAFQEKKQFDTRTEALHEYIKTLQKRAKVAEADLQTLRLFSEEKGVKIAPTVAGSKFKCLVFDDTEITLEECLKCQSIRWHKSCPKIKKVR